MALLRTVKVLYKDKLAFWLTNLSIVLIVATWVLFLFKRVKPDPLAVLHYNIYAGIDSLGSWYWLYIIPAIVLVISLIDFFMALWLWTRFRVMSYFILTAIFIIHAFMFLFLFNILNYNI